MARRPTKNDENTQDFLEENLSKRQGYLKLMEQFLYRFKEIFVRILSK